MSETTRKCGANSCPPHDHPLQEYRPIEIIECERKGPVLTSPKLLCMAPYHTLNLAMGCINQCCYCYAQTYSQHPGWGRIHYFANTVELLKQQLPRMREKPLMVELSSATEPFMPVRRILDDLYEIIHLLLVNGIFIEICSKSLIPDRFINLFSKYPKQINVQVGLTTLNDEARRMIEPHTATVDERLSNLERLVTAGIRCEARMDPLIPGLSDTNESVAAVMQKLKSLGVHEVLAAFLFLRWGISFPGHLQLGNWSAKTMLKLHRQKISNYCGNGTIVLPPAQYRAERIDSLCKIAAEQEIGLIFCRCKNSDLLELGHVCHATPARPHNCDSGMQLSLF